ncbi:hypothetical protein C900_03938 [Fulvivirga imtechensis AK7]|uniref:Uncharacterized protein n=1 Tax=Fulvivirga imtechensis AK7 TaxID=1237149 RepID=L8JQ01_9BACT|nr:WG repeat-containing protein [Fulvivirga imtechensis]ELR70253.1 hypothetical protein C900_03938 [Fulvivirga imtechensis AK7]
MRKLLVIILFFFCLSAQGQVSLSKRALKHLEKGDIHKAVATNKKALEKDSTLVAGFYVQARLFFSPIYHQADIDSAYHYILLARDGFGGLDEKEKKKHENAGVTGLAIESLKDAIDSAAFARSTEKDTEEAYIYFITYFNTAEQVPEAISLRNARAYEQAVQENSYQSYRNFMEKYPGAVQVPEAKKRYEKIYFYERTADNTLKSFLQFLKDNPGTPYRSEAEQNIYAIMTADHSAASYQKFIRQFPKSELRSKAVAFMYHVLKESGQELSPQLMTDSLRALKALYGKVLVPFREAGQYGFMDDRGKEIIAAQYDRVDEGELCGGITRDYLFLDNMIIGINRAPVYKGAYDDVEDLGYGLLKIESQGSIGVYHKSGRKVLPFGAGEVRLLLGKYLAFKKGKRWGLATVSGREITPAAFDDILSLGNFIIFEKGERYDVKNEAMLIQGVDKGRLDVKAGYNDFDLLDDGNLWLQAGSEEAVIDKDCREIIPQSHQKIRVIRDGMLVSKSGGINILNDEYEQVLKVENVKKLRFNASWIGFQQDSLWTLFDVSSYALKANNLDSIGLIGDHFAVISRNDSTAVVTLERPLLLGKNDHITLLAELNSAQYLLIEGDRHRKIILSDKGETLFSGSFDEAKPLGPDYLVISRGSKKGLISADARTLLPMDYDAIGNYSDGFVSLLRNKKFGLYNEKQSVFIPAEYDKNLSPYTPQLFIAEKGGKLGVINGANKKLTAFDYQDVRFWSDSAALVKKSDQWQLLDLVSGAVKEENIRSINFEQAAKGEVRAVVLKEGGYGVWSNIKGEIITPTFNDIVNVGTAERPVYFTEKHIHEAEFYVVIYYDAFGNILRKQAFDAKDYSLIYCDN